MCIFCSIIEKKISANVVAETENVLAFNDINPMAPKHILIIPKIHVANVNELTKDHADILIEMMILAKELGQGAGYRLVINNGEDAGQTVFHLHMHLLSGRDLSWPPG